MSGMIGTAGTIGAFPGGLSGNTVANAAAVAQRLSALTRQVSDGHIADTYAGLGTGIVTALVTGPAIAQQQAWQGNVAAATGTMQVAQTALTQISAIASQFYAQTDNLNGLNLSEIDSVAASARDALTQVAGLLNNTNGSTFVFAGQDNQNPPIPGANAFLSSGYFQQIQAAVGALASAGGPATILATMLIGQSNAPGTSPFAAALSQPAAALANARPVVIGEGGQVVPVGIVASANADIASGGSSTTGSYMRDVLRSLATLGSLSSSQVSASGFSQVVADTRASLGGAITALNADAGVMGNRQAQLQAASQASAATITALQAQLSGAQDVDMASTLSKLTQTQTQLQSSYQLIADSQSLSLVKYLTAGG
jgi:flagellar hook-associated protein 3 FlgL